MKGKQVFHLICLLLSTGAIVFGIAHPVDLALHRVWYYLFWGVNFLVPLVRLIDGKD